MKDFLTFLWTETDGHSFKSKVDAIFDDILQFPYFSFYLIACKKFPIEPRTKERQLFGRKSLISVK